MCVCVRACVEEVIGPWKQVCWGEYFKLDCVELSSMEEDVCAGQRGEYCNHVNIYLHKQNVNIFVLQLPSGTCFQCKCETSHLYPLLSREHPLNLCIAPSASDFNLI